MRRSEALRSLSRGHYQALSIGRDLRRANDAEAAAEKFLEFWNREGALHFRLEEEVLVPYWAAVHAEATARLAREHLQLRAAALEMAGGTRPIAFVRQLGGKLAAHVRFEERELFPLIEADLGAAKLERLARAVADAEENLHA